MSKTQTHVTRREALSLQRQLLRALDRAESSLQDANALIAQIVETEAWTALGYRHSVEWWDTEIGVRRMHPAIREAAVAALRRPHPDTGRQLSQREIATRVDAGVGTVNRDIRRHTSAFESARREVVSTNTGNRWSRDERSMRARVRRGEAVLANPEEHPNLVAWAQAEDGQLMVKIHGHGRWGNPFEAPGDGTEEDVTDLFRMFYLPNKASLIAELDNLRGKVLVCACRSDQACHGHVLLDALNRGVKVPRARRRRGG